MALLYRSIWGSDVPGAVDHAQQAFVGWARDLAVRERDPLPDAAAPSPTGLASPRGRFALDAVSHVDDDDPKITGAVRLRLVECRRDGSRWTTTLRAWTGPSCRGERVGAWVWVDVGAVSHHTAEPLRPHVPGVVPALLTTTRGARPCVDLVPHVTRYGGEEGAEELGDVLTHADRDVPVVVFGGLPDDAGAEAVRVLDTLVVQVAGEVAGLAPVALVDDAARAALTAVVGNEHSVRPGAMRLFLPGVDPAVRGADRHLEIGAARLRGRGDVAGELALGYLAPRSVGRRAPQSYERVRERLAARPAQTPAELEAGMARAAGEIAELRRRLDDEQRAALALIDEHHQLEREANELRARVATLVTEAEAARGSWTDPSLPEGMVGALHARDCSEAASLARRYLGAYLEFPRSAQVDLKTLDRSPAGGAWGEQAWRALRALAFYARERSRGYAGDFRLWCEQSGHPMAWSASPSKLATKESSTVLARWPETRTFPVDGEDVLVESHIKISSAGGVAPRIYFVWVERTRKIHVAYFGRHLRNTLS